MPVDSAAHIASLNAALPAGSDLRTEADNNFRHIKTVLVTDFPNIAGPVTATHTELNFVDGVTSAIQPQLDAKGEFIFDRQGERWGHGCRGVVKPIVQR